jgi:hypothetical protein
MFKFFRKNCFCEKMEKFTFDYDLIWSSFDAHISDTAPPGNLVWPDSKSPRMDLSTDI